MPMAVAVTDLDAQLHRLRIAGLAVNVGANIGFNSVWASVMGPADKRPTPDDIEEMREMIRRGLEQGAYGVSAGLDYKPGYYATAEEVGRVIDVARPWRTNFPNHDRLTPESGYSSRVGVAETIAIGGRSGLVPVVTHMKAQGREQGTRAGAAADDERGDGEGDLRHRRRVSVPGGAERPGRVDHSGMGARRRSRGDARSASRSPTNGRASSRTPRRPCRPASAGRKASMRRATPRS